MPQPLWPRIAAAGAITLGVTAIRLIGELRGWPPAVFGTEAGGGGAWFGIGWLIPLFGAWFAWPLRATAPAPRQALVPVLAGLVLVAGVFTFVSLRLERTVGAMMLAMASTVVAAGLAFHAWPELARALLGYGLLARLPVVALTVPAVLCEWGTHYEKLAPGAPALPAAGRIAALCAAQLFLWVPITMIGGGLVGGLSLLLRRRA